MITTRSRTASWMRTSFRVLVDQFVPASLVGGDSAFAALSQIDHDLGQCHSTGAAAAVLNTGKDNLYQLLQRRFAVPAAQALTLKLLNICTSKYHFHARDSTLLSRPFGLVVDPSNVCELACPGCVHSERSEELKIFDWNKGTLSENRFRDLLRLYGPTAIGIYFCNYGEPLLNLNTPKLIRLAKTYLMSTALSTSLSVRRFDAEAYVESGLDFMVLSVDGATQPVYEIFRRNGKLELVMDNIRALVDAKRRLGKRTPVLSWNFLAFQHNIHEIPVAEQMARKLGVNVFRVVNPFDVGWDDPSVKPATVKSFVKRLDWTSMTNPPENWNPFPDALDADAIGRAFETRFHGTDGTAEPSSGHTCHWLYKNMVMDAHGRIMPCCGAPRPDTNLVFGALDAMGGDHFNSEKYRQARTFFRQGDKPASAGDPYCTQCEWDHTTVNIGSPEIRRYFRAADSSLFDRRALRLLADW
ncbi:MAG: radical SAM/SPASM domain-containing protein [Bryobacteraceae bacterium]